ncbi:MAG TPA: protein-disulfide reductase DsbD domain-containing protein [Terriglobales bacterium]|nr:protein-disulfide reductase DsbD domain-containing protein [Terriglobales bacterium]
MLNRFVMQLAGILLACAGELVFPRLTASADPAAEHTKLELVSEQDAIVPGQKLWLGVRFDLQDGWHTYWVNPGDSGEGPRVEWQLPTGFQAGPIQWPFPARLSTPPLVDYGYEHQVLLMTAVQLPWQAKEGKIETIGARVHYLVCREVCIPGEKQLALSLPVRSRAARSRSGQLFEVTRQRVPQRAPSQWRISVASVANEFVLNLRATTSLESVQFFPLNEEQIENAALQRTSLIPGGVRLHLEKSKHLLKPISRLEGVLVIGSAKAYLVDIPVTNHSGAIPSQ